MSTDDQARDRNLLRLLVAAVVILLALVPTRGMQGFDLWTVTLLLAAAIGSLGLFGAVVLWRSPPMPEEPPPPEEP